MEEQFVELREEIKNSFMKQDFLGIGHTNNNFIFVDEFGISYDMKNDKVRLVTLDLNEYTDLVDLEVPDFIDEVTDNFCIFQKQKVSKKLRSISFGESCKYIGLNAFSDYEYLESVYGDGIETIGISSFERCYNLKNVSFKNIKEVKKNSFLDCMSLKNINIESAFRIQDRALEGCISLETIRLNRVLYLGKYVFNKTCLKDIYLNKKMISTDYYSLSGISLDTKVEYI